MTKAEKIRNVHELMKMYPKRNGKFVKQLIDNDMKKYNLHMGHVAILNNIRIDPEFLSKAYDGVIFDIDAVRKTTMELIERGFLVDNSNGELSNVALTDYAKESIQQNISRIREEQVKIFSVLSEEELDQLVSMMKKLNAEQEAVLGDISV